MKKRPVPTLLFEQHFRDVEDPRVKTMSTHPLLTVLFLVHIGSMCGAEGWDDIIAFARTRRSWLRKRTDLSNGIPSADTVRRVMEAVDPQQFREAFLSYVSAFAGSLKGDLLAVDGKAIKGAYDETNRKMPLHMVHIWSVTQGRLLGISIVPGAPGEVAAIPKLLKLLSMKGAVLTGDANFCTSSVVQAAIEREADYLVCLKGNRGTLHDYVKRFFEQAFASDFAGIPYRFSEQGDRGHGRTEVRRVWVVGHNAFPVDKQAWPCLRTMVAVERTRLVGGQLGSERQYFITSLKPQVRRIGSAIRDHWDIENGLHWRLDACLGEDDCRVRDMNSAANMAFLRRMVFTAFKEDTSVQASLPQKLKMAAWNPDWALEVLSAGFHG